MFWVRGRTTSGGNRGSLLGSFDLQRLVQLLCLPDATFSAAGALCVATGFSTRRLILVLVLWTEIGMAIAAAMIRPTSRGVEHSSSPIGFWPRSMESLATSSSCGVAAGGAVPCFQHRQIAEASLEVTR